MHLPVHGASRSVITVGKPLAVCRWSVVLNLTVDRRACACFELWSPHVVYLDIPPISSTFVRYAYVPANGFDVALLLGTLSGRDAMNHFLSLDLM